VSRPVLNQNQTVATVSFSTAPRNVPAEANKGGLWRVGKWTRVERGRSVSPCIHTGSNDTAFRWLSQCGGI